MRILGGRERQLITVARTHVAPVSVWHSGHVRDYQHRRARDNSRRVARIGRGNPSKREPERGRCVLAGLRFVINVARSVLPDATVTAALVGSFIYPAETTLLPCTPLSGEGV